MILKKKKNWIAVLLAVSILYGLDDLSARFGVPSRPQFATMTVKRYFYINEKYNKFSYEPLPSMDVRCVTALFPHSGYRPCWYLKRHLMETIPVN